MPNHVHLILLPRDPDGLRAALGQAHRRYTRLVNFREGWRGYLWQGRFSSFPMDEQYLLACAHYVELNPVRAGLVAQPEARRWSSAAALLGRRRDGLVDIEPLARLVRDWRQFLAGALGDEDRDSIRAHERTGRPLGAERFVKGLERRLGRPLARQKPGRKPRDGDAAIYV
jgi:putative transposase